MIYKDHAAERYARAIEVSRQERGGLEAYQRRVVAASTDAERYRGYVETSTPRGVGGRKGEEEEEAEGGQGLGLLLGDGGGMSSDFTASSNDREGSSLGAGMAPGEGRVASSDFSLPHDRESTEENAFTPGAPAVEGDGGRATDVRLGDGAASEGSAAQVASAGVSFVEGGHAPAAIWKARTDDGGGRGSFVDVVPFNNIRAKYLRPLDDTELSRPYHVAPSPSWRPDCAVGGRSLGSSADGSSTPTSTKDAPNIVDAAASERTMEAYRKTKQRDLATNHRRRSKALNWKQRMEWGAN